MKNSFSTQLSFYITLIFILLLAFFVQTNFFHFPASENEIIRSYVINAIMAIVIFNAIDRIKKTKPEIAGFVFMGGSALKFLVFFIVFYPIFKEDGEISKPEFLSFFTPYTLCLVVEVFFLLKLLNK